jgi:hypothetical protein
MPDSENLDFQERGWGFELWKGGGAPLNFASRCASHHLHIHFGIY